MRNFIRLLNGRLTSFFNRKYFFLIFLILRGILAKSGKIIFQGWKIRFNDANSLIGMYNEIIVQDCYKFDCESESPVIIDCGANIGISLLYFLKQNPKAQITAYEADPIIFQILKCNIEQNGYIANLIERAVWINSNEEISFGCIGADSGSLFESASTIQVKTIRLKEELARFKRIDLLKIDIEGAELEVIKDCENDLALVERVFIEYHSFNDSDQDLDVLLNIMKKAGFRYKILPARKEKSPFFYYNKEQKMDLQLNIFFFRK